MNQHITRAYNSFNINNGILQKLSKENRLKDEIDYYRKINEFPDLSFLFPRYFNHLSTNNDKDEHILALEYLAYNNLGHKMLNDTMYDEKFWQQIINLIKYSLNQFKKYKQKGDFQNLGKEMYIEKTEKYYYELKNNFRFFSKACLNKQIIINDKYYENFEIIWSKIKNIISKTILKINSLSVIHGDCCFSNILYGINPLTNIHVIRFVDPRGSFGNVGIYGDPLYDIAKLRHSYEGGYEFIIYDKFSLGYDDELRNKFWFSFKNEQIRTHISQLFNKNTLYNSLETKLIEGLIFVGMCSRHYDCTPRQIVMYCTGIKILNEVIEEYENMH